MKQANSISREVLEHMFTFCESFGMRTGILIGNKFCLDQYTQQSGHNPRWAVQMSTIWGHTRVIAQTLSTNILTCHLLHSNKKAFILSADNLKNLQKKKKRLPSMTEQIMFILIHFFVVEKIFEFFIVIQCKQMTEVYFIP